MAREPISLVGRWAELSRLDGYLADPGGPGLVVVVGEAGIGKTRLVDAFATGAVARRRVVRGRADEHEAVAFGVWLGPLNQLGLPRPGNDASVPPSELRWDVVDLLASGLRASAPMLVVLDDLHWADDDSLWVLEHVLDRVSGAAVSILATTRPGSEARSVRWHAVYRRAQVVALEGLARTEVADLVGLLGGSPADAEQVWRLSGGNPLFVRELVLSGADRTATAADLLAAAIERVGPAVADLVSLLALAGPGTPRDVVAAAGGREVDEVEELLRAARQADLVRNDEGQIRLRHDLLAEAAIRRCGPAKRRDLHRALADAWARRTGLESQSSQARHQLLAVPDIDATVAADAALAAARSLVAEGRAADAAGLLRLAGGVLEPRGEVAPDVKARVALAEYEARWALDDLEGAAAASEVAVAHAAQSGDPVLIAAAEIAVVAHHNPTEPDPARSARLAAVDEALPAAHDDIDPTLRIRLRGRRAVLLTSWPDRLAEAYALSDDAVARARSLGDPEILVRALADRFFVLATPADYDARERAADEIVDLARRSRRTELARTGHEWRYAARLGAGDLEGAVAALADLEALAAIMPSPLWRWATALRRSGLLAMLGDYDGAMSLAATARQLASGVAPELEAAGLDGALRLAIAALYRRTDDGADRFSDENMKEFDAAPVMFVQAHFARSEALLGEPAAARRRLTPWLGRLDAALRGVGGLGLTGWLADTVALLGWAQPASELRALLRPFAGRLAGGPGPICDLPVDHHLAELALLDGDVDEAAARARAAVAFARRLRAPAVEARTLALLAAVSARTGDAEAAASAGEAAAALAEPIGMVLPIAAASKPASRRPPADDGERRVRLRLDHARWFIDAPFGAGHVADSTGMAQLVRLVLAPGEEIAAVDLAAASGRGAVVVTSDLGPALDAQAKREYRQRISELQAEIDEAEGYHDPERAAKHRLELDALLAELRVAVGLGGRDRPQGSGSERARVNVSRSIRRAIAAIAAVIPNLGAHLEVSIRTGHRCSYAPEPAARLSWQVD